MASLAPLFDELERIAVRMGVIALRLRALLEPVPALPSDDPLEMGLGE